MNEPELGTGRILARVENGIGWITFNHPERRNAMSLVGSSRVDLQACKLEYSIVSPK